MDAKSLIQPAEQTLTQQQLERLLALVNNHDIESFRETLKLLRTDGVQVDRVRFEGDQSLLDYAVLHDAVQCVWELVDPLNIYRQNPHLGELGHELQAIHRQERGYFFSRRDLLTAVFKLWQIREGLENVDRVAQPLPKIHEIVGVGCGLIRFLDILTPPELAEEIKEAPTVFEALFHSGCLVTSDDKRKYRYFGKYGVVYDFDIFIALDSFCKHKPYVVDFSAEDKVIKQLMIELFVRIRWIVMLACRKYINLRRENNQKLPSQKESQGIIWARELSDKMSRATTISAVIDIFTKHMSRRKGLKTSALTAQSLDRIIIETIQSDQVLNRYLRIFVAERIENQADEAPKGMRHKFETMKDKMQTIGWRKMKMPAKMSIGFSPLFLSEETLSGRSKGIAPYVHRYNLLFALKFLAQIAKQFGVDMLIDKSKSPDEQAFYSAYQLPTLKMESDVIASLSNSK